MKQTIKQTITAFVLLTFFLQGLSLPAVYAQTPVRTASDLVSLTPAFNPPVLRGLRVDLQDPFHFNFILDKGQSTMADTEIKSEGTKLIKYFLASLTLPENDLWVNLSPNEKDRVITNEFGRTEMGRQLLSEDYLLKKLSASLLYPDSETGKKFWDKVRQITSEKLGTTDVPMDTLTRIWIMPQKAVVYQDAGTAFIGETKLKVLMEEEYEKKSLVPGFLSLVNTNQAPGTNGQAPSSKIFRSEILPLIEKEVNEGKSFASLRQIYFSLILASWYKRTLKQSVLSQIYVDQKKVAGVETDEKNAKERIYNQYLETFKKGVYNLIREEEDSSTGEMIPRKYFSGGVTMLETASAIEGLPLTKAAGIPTGNLVNLDASAKGVINNIVQTAASPLLQIHDFLIPNDMINFFVAHEKVSPPGWWIAFDLDNMSSVPRREINRILKAFDNLLLDELNSLGIARIKLFSTAQTRTRTYKEEGYIFIPGNYSKENLAGRLNDIRLKFQSKQKKTVTFSVMRSESMEMAAFGKYGISKEISGNEYARIRPDIFWTYRIITKCLTDLLDDSKGVKDSADYGNKVVFLEDVNGGLIDLSSGDDSGQVTSAAGSAVAKEISQRSTSSSVLSAGEKYFKSWSDMQEFFRAHGGQFDKGWWIKFDVDRASQITFENDKEDIFAYLNEKLVEQLTPLQAILFSSILTTGSVNKEEGFIYLPEDYTPDKVKEVLDAVKEDFKNQKRQTVTFGLIRGADLETAPVAPDVQPKPDLSLRRNSANRVTLNLMAVQNVTENLLRSGRGSKFDLQNSSYGDKVVFYPSTAGSAVGENERELRAVKSTAKKAGSPTEVGGIDMREKTMNLDLRGKAGTFILPADPAQIQNIRIDGLVPVINSMTPVSDLSAFLKLGQMSHEKQAEPALNSS